jgi:hypothetical protein
MPDKETKEAEKTTVKDVKVTFKCQCCNRNRPLKEMRRITRFLPVMIVCQECDKALR